MNSKWENQGYIFCKILWLGGNGAGGKNEAVSNRMQKKEKRKRKKGKGKRRKGKECFFV